MAARGKPPQIATVRNMANLLLFEREIKSESKPPSTVGVNWVQNFVNRHNELKSRFSRKSQCNWLSFTYNDYSEGKDASILLPLDVSCFSPLKKAYGQHMEEQMWLDINHIDKKEFLTLYSAAHMKALNENNIKSGFKATGAAILAKENKELRAANEKQKRK
ncbi:conserved hypothetical protein [Histoplasma mississippiense (nom. inval.)]|uniref:conserved hypothetical protein n=1 Tax=Ajellomyces capsulatus (strain NAm1 / WU24) TaxID=2059318 RepID=UPI000157B736|nr:conserved hypothetical protein [Histoplasma mississippiense (nom. inval.)]EDN03664.1 conserved hypothetical protein [Histoplasma mississippiense (nom. inval.)]